MFSVVMEQKDVYLLQKAAVETYNQKWLLY